MPAHDDFNAASMAIYEGDRVLSIRRAREPFLDHWSLPGGRREIGETAIQCAIREVSEETGLVVLDAAPVVTIDISQGPRPFLLSVFVSDDFEGDLVGSEEISGHAWVSNDELDGYLVTPELPQVLARALAVLRQQSARP